MYTTQEQTSLKAFAAEVSESILAAYHAEFGDTDNSLEAEEYAAVNAKTWANKAFVYNESVEAQIAS